MARYRRKSTLQPTVALPLPSLVFLAFNQGFNGYFESFNHMLARVIFFKPPSNPKPTCDGRVKTTAGSFGNYKMNTDNTMETQWASMLEQRMENIVATPQYTHYLSATFQEN
ncbi:hypothetical protein M9H77_30853 [Catharanthus roseus]|uniref:Uncharacterized protein n=1 Tax=Catharanthus roseus TaxID=4058 RepID=A0ACB9ZYT9_CATRO|nr:hypothetical protein M9H77_30853 [Catharanthus roseus]